MSGEQHLAVLCCMCNGVVYLLHAKRGHLDTPWGRFELQWHLACENKEFITEKLKEMALTAQPK